MADNLHNPFPEFLRTFKGYVSKLPMRISQRAVLEMKNNFASQGYETEDGRRIKWAERKLKQKGSKRAILIKSGRLRRSPKADPLPMIARVTTDVPYAGALNDGFKGTEYVRPFKRVATRNVRIRGSMGNATKIGKGKKVAMMGARHNVKGFTRKMNIPARPFLTVGKSFMDREERELLDSLENIFLQA